MYIQNFSYKSDKTHKFAVCLFILIISTFR